MYTLFVGKVNGALRKLEAVLTAKDGVSPHVLNLGSKVGIIQLKLDPNKLDPGGVEIKKYTILDRFEDRSVPSHGCISNGSPSCIVSQKNYQVCKVCPVAKELAFRIGKA